MNFEGQHESTHHPQPTIHHPPHFLEGGKSALPIPTRYISVIKINMLPEVVQ